MPRPRLEGEFGKRPGNRGCQREPLQKSGGLPFVAKSDKIESVNRREIERHLEAGSRCKQLEVILDEIDAVRHSMSRANRGDLVVLCVDQHPAVMS